MRFAAAATLSAALLAGLAHADDAADESASAAAFADWITATAVLPTFTPIAVQGDFVEQFTEGWEERWKVSNAKKDTKGGQEEWAYVGEWAVEEPTVYKGMEGDAGLVLKNKAAHHAISAKFPAPVDNKDKTLVVQYEVKLQNGLECGGAYMKLLRDTKELHQEEFSNASPYVIMFGPDKCGTTNKVHFIVNHKNPKTGEYEEKHMDKAPSARILQTTELYTLIVHPNNTFAIQLNGEQVREGSLLEDFTPAFNPPAEIDDPEDSKPEDWVDEERIADPEATKPEDWDEDAPFEIVDEAAVQPEDWLVDEALTIPDPEAEKPEDWDDEEDGDWVAPTVPNPACSEAAGCGPWSKPMIKNPAYKGKWRAPLIDNPAYKGEWAPRKIANPNYYEDKTPANLEPMGAIGFEIWTMQNDILFDNIYIGHSIEEAKKLADDTFHKKYSVEQLLSLKDSPKDEKKTSPSELVFTEDPVTYIKEKLDLFMTIAKADPIEAVKFVPEVAAGIGAVVVAVLFLLSTVLGGSAPPAASKAAAKAADVKDKAAAATASGVDAGKEAVKRATKSSE